MSISTSTIKTPIGLSLPIKRGNVGYFDQSIDTFSQIKHNIMNLLKTKRGERRLNPMFGSRLNEFIFEQNDENVLKDKIINTIKEDMIRWVSNVSVQDISLQLFRNDDVDNVDKYRLKIGIKYIINIVNQTDSVEFILEGKIQ